MSHNDAVTQPTMLRISRGYVLGLMVGAMGDAAAGLASSVAPTDSRSPAMQLHYYCYY